MRPWPWWVVGLLGTQIVLAVLFVAGCGFDVGMVLLETPCETWEDLRPAVQTWQSGSFWGAVGVWVLGAVSFGVRWERGGLVVLGLLVPVELAAAALSLYVTFEYTFLHCLKLDGLGLLDGC